MLHPEVQKYIQRNTSKGGKARWAGTTAKERKEMLEKAHAGARAYFAELRKRKWKEQFYED